MLTDENDELNCLLDESYDKITNSISNFTSDGSGWSVDAVLKLELVVGRYQPLAASSYIPTPRKLSLTKAVVNIKNSQDEMCFLWSVLAHIYPQKDHKDRVSKYLPFINTISMSGIEYPVSINSISKFETQNPNISINVFGYDIEDNIRNESKNEVYPLRITSNKDRLHHVNLLLLSDTNSRKHYCLVSSINKLLFSLTKHSNKSF